MRLHLHLIAFLGFLLLPSYADAQNQAATKENLDLPFDAFGISEDEEEKSRMDDRRGEPIQDDALLRKGRSGVLNPSLQQVDGAAA